MCIWYDIAEFIVEFVNENDVCFLWSVRGFCLGKRLQIEGVHNNPIGFLGRNKNYSMYVLLLKRIKQVCM